MSEKLLVPDIGDFENVEVIEILVKPGDQIKENDPIVTIESDKSSVEIPSTIAGKVDSLAVKVGDKVSYAGIPLGSYSSNRNYPTKNLVKLPDGIDLEIAATLMTKGLTTFYLLHKTYPVKSGETILFHAAAGGVGQIFGQWAKSLGCTVIGTVGSDEKVNIAKENGYDHVINYNKEDFAKKSFRNYKW